MLSVVALGLTVVSVGSGGIAPIVSGIASAFGGVIDQAGATRAPSATPPPPVADAPLIAAPSNPYTNVATVDVQVSIPADVVGKPGHTVRLFVTLPETPAQLIAQAPVGPTALVALQATPLVAGQNAFHATIEGPSGESDPSPTVTWILDQNPPQVTITAPKNGAVVNRGVVAVKGKTQARSTVLARNEANGATAAATANAEGLFELVIAVGAGVNGITVTATDPARNTGSAIVSVRKGSGVLTARLSAGAYKFSAAKLPADVQFVVLVTDPDGRPLSGARATFTMTVPGLEAILSSELSTAGDGTAVFRTRIPNGAQVGSGLASVLVTTGEFGSVTDRQVLTIVK